MFTGIVSGVGRVRSVEPNGATRDMRIVIGTPADTPAWADTARIAIGASICCSGCCLTAVEVGPDWFAVTASAETLARTTLGGWRVGTPVNLERSLRVGDEFGGHIVAGHVDGVGEVTAITPDHGSTRWSFRIPAALAPYIAVKGSVAVDGVSLTVNEAGRDDFAVNIIPHTHEVTTLGGLRAGALVNIEIDTVARYVARLREFG